MKKLMIAAAAALCATVGYSDIESANVVGYTTKTVEAGKFYLVGVQFDKPGEAAGKIDMNDLISLSKDIVPGEYDKDFVGAPQIQVLKADGSGYTRYYYISDATDDDDEELGFDCWADTDGYQLTDSDKLNLGKGFWFYSEKNGSITIAGEVSSSADAVVAFPKDTFYIVANPFPVDFSLASVTMTGVTPSTYEDDFDGASQIQVLKDDASGYTRYYYISDATDDNDDEVGYDCWADTDGYILTGNQVKAGASFWIYGNAAGTIGFAK